jgi:hypothetical protein
MAEHTPGPWELKFSTHDYGEVAFKSFDGLCGPDGKKICLRGASLACGGELNDDAMANSRLVAAAPDLLEALQECLREHGGYTIKGECERRARAAIEKATQSMKGECDEGE